MKTLLNIQGKSQFDQDIQAAYRPSACGPVTAFVILQYHFPSACRYNVNELYRLLGGTKIGLFKWRFIRNMRKLLGAAWLVAECDIEEAIRQIDSGRIVAAKFDKWFNFRWRGSYAFDYHWVPVIGYEKVNDDLRLIIHDNGGRNRPSQVRHISYKRNKPVLSFVKVEPKS
ncbi:hypothetical protein ACFPRA_21020 [Sporosarcina soli]|uniref:Peptidase C39-like domain-containing protein n=1 Tax=Sporosarcina soli TaxID=334736 RepID=A0ABW0TPE2_9BACL